MPTATAPARPATGVTSTSSGIQRTIAGRLLQLLLLSLPALLFSDRADGALLNLMGGSPDISAQQVVVTFDGDPLSRDFRAMGTAVQLHLDVPSTADYTIFGGLFDIAVKIDTAGMPMPGGLLTITGTIPHPDLGLTGPDPLLTAKIVKFGYQEPTPTNPLTTAGPRLFEFEFEILGGTLAPQYGGIGSSGGVTLSSGKINFTGHFNNVLDFGPVGTSSGTADTFGEVPEPTSVVIWLLGGLACAARCVSTRAQRRTRGGNAQ